MSSIFPDLRVGQGYDIHLLAPKKPLILGGVTIPHHSGLEGHSDADCLIHAIIDALLGACALGDIGKHYSDKDEKYAKIDSRILLRTTLTKMSALGFRIINIDSSIIAEKPRLSSYTLCMRQNIAEDLKLPIERINIKCKTNELCDAVGQQTAIAAQAIVLVLSSPDPD